MAVAVDYSFIDIMNAVDGGNPPVIPNSSVPVFKFEN
jgi:hypothetical protein